MNILPLSLIILFGIYLALLNVLIGVVSYVVWWDFTISFAFGFKIVVGIVALVCIAYIIGLLLPKQKPCTKRYNIDAPVDLVWSVISDYKDRAKWYDNIFKAELVALEASEVWRTYWHSAHAEKSYTDVTITKQCQPTEFQCKFSFLVFGNKTLREAFLGLDKGRSATSELWACRDEYIHSIEGEKCYWLENSGNSTIVTCTTKFFEKRNHPLIRFYLRISRMVQNTQKEEFEQYTNRIKQLI